MTNLMNLHELFNKAQAAQAANEFEQATQLFHQFLEQTESEITVLETAVSKTHERRLIALTNNGRILRLLGQQKAALATYQQLNKEASTNQEKSVAMAQLANQYNKMGQHDRAFTLSTKAMYLAQTNNDTFGRALAIQNIGAALFQLGRYDEALAQLKTAVSLFLQLGNVNEEMRSWNLTGITYSIKGELDKAIIALEKALLLVRSVGDIDTVYVLCNLGETYQELFDNERAIVYHQEALTLAQNVPLSTLTIDPQRNLGVIFCRLGKIEQGLAYLTQALKWSKQFEVHDLTLQALYSLAFAEAQYGDLEKAEQVAHQLLKLAQQSKARGSESQALYVLGICAQKQPNNAEDNVLAEQYWQQALFLAHDTDTAQRTLFWQIHSALAQVSEKPQLSKTHYRIAAEVIEQIVYPLEDDSLRQTFLNEPIIRAILDQVR